MIIIKNQSQIEGITKSCKLTSDTMKYIEPFVIAGITTEKLDSLIHDYIISHNGTPATLNYQNFPKSSCISINEQICHGIPDGTILKDGDIVKIDIATILNGYFGDMCKTFAVGSVSLEARKLMLVTKNALESAIELVRPGAYIGDIGDFIYSFATSLGYGVIKEFCGHGVGLEFHESPQVFHVASKGTGDKMVPGMVFTIEPMLCTKHSDMLILENNWTAVTKDKGLSAQFEHTILVTKTGYEILTKI